jgi:hypothetical protein
MMPCLYCEDLTYIFCACGAHQCHTCARLDAHCPICTRVEQAKANLNLLKRIMLQHITFVTFPLVRAIDQYATQKITAVLDTVKEKYS